ncbi:MAG: 1-acyl-sn-glycerol-3-phosphate acyltransferase [Armatimonadetes bacterium]|nr:1-acyl-sn-glycerol-3-phosphate acyltransferase [Armatimonadota bacterium]
MKVGIGCGIARALLKGLVFSYIRVESASRDRIPDCGPAILCGNHPNILDGLLLGLVSPRPVRFLVAGGLFRVPVLGNLLRWFGAIPVDRSGGSNSDALQAAVAALENGELIGIFPEGRTNGGAELLDFKAGVALLAHRTGCPVVPFAVEGTQRLYPYGSLVTRPGSVRIEFGDSLGCERVAEPRIPQAVIARTVGSVRERVAGLWARLRHHPAGCLPEPLGALLSGTILVPLSLVVSLGQRHSSEAQAPANRRGKLTAESRELIDITFGCARSAFYPSSFRSTVYRPSSTVCQPASHQGGQKPARRSRAREWEACCKTFASAGTRSKPERAS